MSDRIDAIADLLLGAAYADDHLNDRERSTIRDLLGTLIGDTELSASLGTRIDGFDPGSFDLASCAAAFASDSAKDKRKLLELVAAVHDADHVLDLAENDYLKSVAHAVGVGEGELDGLVLQVEVEDLRGGLSKLRATPPPIPDSAETDVDLGD